MRKELIEEFEEIVDEISEDAQNQRAYADYSPKDTVQCKIATGIEGRVKVLKEVLEELKRIENVNP